MTANSLTSDGPASGDTPSTGTPLEAIVSDFELLEEWEDRYRYVIELGRALPLFPETARTETNKVRGCASQVWLATAISAEKPQPRLTFQGDSDAHIVRGLIAILLAVYSGQRADEILAIDANAILRTLGLADHLSAQRSNGLTSMVERIRADARAASMR